MKWLILVGYFLFVNVSWGQGSSPSLPAFDVSSELPRQVVIAQGTNEIYQGHPTTVYLPDDTSIICVWSYDHGGRCGPMALTLDGGQSWEPKETPADWELMSNCPSIYRLVDKLGVARLFTFASHPNMASTHSLDDGTTWSPVKSLGFSAVMPFTTIVRLSSGDHLGQYNRRPEGIDGPPENEVWQSFSRNGGLTWEEPSLVVHMDDHIPCEPEIIRNHKSGQLLCLMRDNNRGGHSLMMTSEDEGLSWSSPMQTPWGLTGDRHKHQFAPDGRLVVAFRDQAPGSPSLHHFVVWVGTYEDIILGREGLYRVKLLHSYAGPDCGYPGLEVLPDGTFIATTYVKYRAGIAKHSVVSVRFNLGELDALADQ